MDCFECSAHPLPSRKHLDVIADGWDDDIYIFSQQLVQRFELMALAFTKVLTE
jgi:hypothetical protein